MIRAARGQRWISETEPELGVGICTETGSGRISLEFPATGVQRQYATDSAPIQRVEFRPGDRITTRGGEILAVENVVAGADGVLIYESAGRAIPETELSDALSFSKPEERLLIGQVDDNRTFELRYEALRCRHQIRQSPVRGFVGGRIDLIPHQLFVAHEVASRPLPRVLLADEVGLGKTIEACLILHRLYRSGRAARILVLLPEPLVHQWFVELLRRFNLLFAIFDEERCAAIVAHQPDANPFLDDQLVLCPISLLAGNETRRAQAAAAGWDLVIVDEAHHLAWTPDSVSAEYAAVDSVARESPGLILLTATPEQLGVQGHFARLHLLDPGRFDDFEKFQTERKHYQKIAKLAGKLHEGETLTPAEKKELQKWTGRTPRELEKAEPQTLLADLLDRHGTGRVMFRNTRAAMRGFPKRQVLLAPLSASDSDEARFAERVDWLVSLLQKLRGAKILLICKTRELVLTLEAALRERINAKVGLFHEGLTLLQRDRNAAWFAEPDGAQLLLCSEIGSEGRNFQFAHHLVLFDLPLDPELLEQRIGRLDRIGQTETIRIHVPYAKSSALETLARWYHQGLRAFERSMVGGAEVSEKFGKRLRDVLQRFSESALEKLISDTRNFHGELLKRLEKGQDRLLQMSSCRQEEAARLVEGVAATDRGRSLEPFLFRVFDHFGVHVEELSERTFFALPGNLTTETFPELPEEGLSFTSDRAKALSREDIGFLTWDHPVVTGAIDLLLGMEQGNSAFAVWVSPGEQAIYLEMIYVVETVAPPELHADRFLAPTPLRVVIDAKGEDRSAIVHPPPDALVSGSPFALLDNPRIKQTLLPMMLQRGRDAAMARAREFTSRAEAAMREMLQHEIDRLTELRKVNDHIRPEEIAAIERQLVELAGCIASAQIRLEAVRLIWKTPVAPE